LWEENGVVPILAIEVVSKTYGQEYHSKLSKYAQIGALYYVIYNPDYWERDRHEPFEVYRLEGNGYVRQMHEPVLIPEINLAIGRGQGSYEGWNREWLYWYEVDGNRLPSPLEWAQRAQLQAQQAQLQAQQERQLKEDLIAKLQARGLDPDTLPVPE
jgi:hypothetical protein